MALSLPPRLRVALSSLLAGGAALLVTQILLPGQGGGRGTPAAILFGGTVLGLLNALTAVALVVVYRSTRVVNFAQTAIGAAGAVLAFQLLQFTPVPLMVALPLGLVVSGAMGAVFDLVIGRRFFRAPRLVLTVATIAVAGFLAATARSAINALPIFPQERTLEQLAGIESLRPRLPMADLVFTVGGLQIPFGFAELLAIAGSLVALTGVGAYLRFARSGVAVRAMAENTERAALLGISTGTLSTIVWTIAGLLSGTGLILTGLLANPAVVNGVAPTVLLPAMAAAVIGRMRSLPVTAAAAVGISVVSGAFSYSLPDHGPLLDVALFGVIGLGLLAQRRTVLRSEDGGGVSWEAAQEQRPIPRELLAVRGVRLTRTGLALAGLVGVCLYPFVVSTGPIVLGSVIALNGIVALSILVLTGWAGQVSLGQYAFAAVGGVVGAALTGTVGLPFWLAVPPAAAVTAAFAALVGIPALRIKGLFLAVSTFALAIAVSAVLFEPRYFGWLLPDAVNRPRLLLLDFEDERSMYFLCVLALVLAIAVVVNLRRGRTGRVLIAARENDTNLQSLGMSAVRAKLLAFAVSGALAGFAGAVFVHLQRGVSAGSFAPQRSVDLFLLAVLGGVSSVPGVLLGAVFTNVTTFFLSDNVIYAAVQPFFVVLLLFVEPGGLIGLVNRLRDGLLRIVAQRRQIVVPSLFADYDPDALARRLIPLGPPIPKAGLNALPDGARFHLSSVLHGRGRRAVAVLDPSRRGAEDGAIRAAARATEQLEQVEAAATVTSGTEHQ